MKQKNEKLRHKLRKRVWQTKFNEACNKLYNKYKKDFEDAVLKGNMRTKDVLNLLKIMVAPMRFGKTRLAIEHHIPFLFNHTDVNLIVLTSPLGSILKQKRRKLQKVIRNLENVELHDNPLDAKEALDDGGKVVIIMTNQAAWVGSKAVQLYDECDKSKTAIIVDEAHTWTTDCKENLPDVIGGGGDKFKAVLYTIVKDFSKISPYIFGLTATSNNQHNGKVPALNNMQFTVINSDFVNVIKAVKKLSYRMAWFDKKRVRYFTENSLDGMNTNEAWNDMMETHMEKEKVTGKKITTFVESKRKVPEYGTPKQHRTAENEELKKCLKMFRKDNHGFVRTVFEAEDVDYKTSPVIAVMNGDRIDYESLSGNVITKNIDEKEVYADLNDPNHTLRFLVVIDMAKMGVDLPNTKNFFSFRDGWKHKVSKKFGLIKESFIQKFGRLLTVYSGLSDDKFYSEPFVGDVRNVPDFHPEQNMMDFWIVDNPLNRQAMEDFENYFSSGVPDLSDGMIICPTCGQPWPDGNHGFHASVELDKKIENILDSELVH